MNRIQELIELMPPPDEPFERLGEFGWLECASKLTSLPDDYRDFLQCFGTGLVGGFICVYNPVATNEYLNLYWQAERVLSALKTTSSKFPGVFSMPLFPEKGGLLPFAGTDNGDALYWVTVGDPNEWSVAVMDARSPDFFEYDGGMSAFLADVLKRHIQCPIFPGDFPDSPPISFLSL